MSSAKQILLRSCSTDPEFLLQYTWHSTWLCEYAGPPSSGRRAQQVAPAALASASRPTKPVAGSSVRGDHCFSPESTGHRMPKRSVAAPSKREGTSEESLVRPPICTRTSSLPRYRISASQNPEGCNPTGTAMNLRMHIFVCRLVSCSRIPCCAVE